MQILVAEDDLVTRKMIQTALQHWGYDVLLCADGDEAWNQLIRNDSPPLALLDWMMPGRDGLEICRDVRKHPTLSFKYLILLTVRGDRKDVVAGLDAGADDYIVKPFDQSELRSRIRAGERIVSLEQFLSQKLDELQHAADNVRQLTGIIPMCAWCKKVRDDEAYWHQVEDYLGQRSEAEFSHSICPECQKEYLAESSKAYDATPV